MYIWMSAIATSLAAALVIGALGGLMAGFMVAGAGYAARQITRED